MADTMLEAIFENEEVTSYVDSCGEQIEEAAAIFHETPQQIKDYIAENMEQFLVPGDLEATYVKLVDFVENCVVNNLNDLCEAIIADDEEVE